jgi:hypothetical protein
MRFELVAQYFGAVKAQQALRYAAQCKQVQLGTAELTKPFIDQACIWILARAILAVCPSQSSLALLTWSKSVIEFLALPEIKAEAHTACAASWEGV